MSATPSYATVFSGGGAHGAWEVGCLRALITHFGKPPLLVAGASAGALNATGVAMGLTPDELATLWLETKPQDVYSKKKPWTSTAAIVGRLGWRTLRLRSFRKSLLSLLAEGNSIFDTSPLETTLDKHFKAQMSILRGSDTGLALTLTDLQNNEARVYCHLPPPPKQPLPPSWRDLASYTDLSNALMGSTAIPILFPPYHYLFDGGVLNNSPIAAIRTLATLTSRSIDILVVLIPSIEANPSLNGLDDVGKRLLRVWIESSLGRQLRDLRNDNEVIAPALGEPPLPVICIRPTLDLEDAFDVGLLDFGKKVDKLINDGATATIQRLRAFDLYNAASWY